MDTQLVRQSLSQAKLNSTVAHGVACIFRAALPSQRWTLLGFCLISSMVLDRFQLNQMKHQITWKESLPTPRTHTLLGY